MTASLDLYRTFNYVARYRSITAAAHALYVTQPTVTHAIQMLEAELDCILFIRSRKGVTLTPEGAMLYEQTAAAFSRLSEAQEHLQARRKLKEGQIRLGASETTLHHFLLPPLKSFRSGHPEIKFKITNYNTPAAIAALRNGSIDFAVLVMPPEGENYSGGIGLDELSVSRLTGFQDIFIAGEEFHDLKKPQVELRELTLYPFICMEPGSITRQFLDHFFLHNHITLNPDIELATTDLISPFASNNMGVGFVPRVFAQAALDEGSVFQIRLKEPIPQRDICVITRADQPLSLAAQAFLDTLIQGAPAAT